VHPRVKNKTHAQTHSNQVQIWITSVKMHSNLQLSDAKTHRLPERQTAIARKARTSWHEAPSLTILSKRPLNSLPGLPDYSNRHL
jgi:hypothetical protein